MRWRVFFCYASDHAQFIGNTVRNTAGSDIAGVGCDYLVSDHNLINHNGYLPAVCLPSPGSNPPSSPPADLQSVCGSASNSSGISYNNVTTPAGDTYHIKGFTTSSRTTSLPERWISASFGRHNCVREQRVVRATSPRTEMESFWTS